MFFLPYSTDAPIYHRPIATVGLIILNTALFFAVPTRFLEPNQALAFPTAGALDDLGARASGEIGNGAELEPSENQLGQRTPKLILEYGAGLRPWQWLTSAFMHQDFFHLLFNMAALWAFGLVVEGKVGGFGFLGLYLCIAVGQSGLEQIMMLFSSGGGSLGASAAILGVLGMAIVWAPSNNFDVFWFFAFRTGTFELSIAMYGFLAFVLEFVAMGFGGFGVSSSLLHLMGLGFGLALGFVALRYNWVDCEGWDLINVWNGREGRRAEHEQDDAAVGHLLRSATPSRLGSRKSQAHASANRDPHESRQPGFPESGKVDWNDTVALRTVAEVIESGNYQLALKLIAKFEKNGNPLSLPQPLHFKLIRDLLAAQDFRAAVPWIVIHIDRFAAGRCKLQLNLAKIHLHLEQPKKSVRVLRAMDAAALSDSERAVRKQLYAAAQQMIRANTLELDD